MIMEEDKYPLPEFCEDDREYGNIPYLHTISDIDARLVLFLNRHITREEFLNDIFHNFVRISSDRFNVGYDIAMKKYKKENE